MTRSADLVRRGGFAFAIAGICLLAAGCPVSPEVRDLPDSGWIDAKADTHLEPDPDTNGGIGDTGVTDTGTTPPEDTTAPSDTTVDPTDTRPSDTGTPRDTAPDTRDAGRDTSQMQDTGTKDTGPSYPRWNIQPNSNELDCAAADQCITYFCHDSFDKSCAKFYVQRAGTPGASRGSKLQACYHWKCPNRKDSCLSRVNSNGGVCEPEYDGCYRSPQGNKLNCSEILECILTDCTGGSIRCRQNCRDRGAEGEALKLENFFGCFNQHCRSASDGAECMVKNCRPRIEGCFGC
jgi:hypothetical protein